MSEPQPLLRTGLPALFRAWGTLARAVAQPRSVTLLSLDPAEVARRLAHQIARDEHQS
ncbi:hypothetical protein FHS91_001367 [Sphingobium xanthum]|jgi:hypothetical protein|uniref:hypothetical protein n=1 Tax=Sphingobium xanthum TaxID=1387165 RepID=UPI001C8C5012|nr:hypothetical protein [Sphingobium xanthum]